MKKYDFNMNWRVAKLNDDNWKEVNIPYDAMLWEKRTEDSLGGLNIGWFESLDYVYEKEFILGDEYKNKTLSFEFEGVYHLAEVFLNGEKVAYRPYGYSNFYVNNAEKHIKFNEKNVIKVIATNSNQPNSRWYSGTGIYRPVWLYVGEEQHIENNGVKFTTKSLNPTIIEVEVKTNTSGSLNIDIPIANINETVETNGLFKKEFEIKNPKLWSADEPNLYECVLTFGKDVVRERLGIRRLGTEG